MHGCSLSLYVFGAIALGEALHHHGHVLASEIRNQWIQRLAKAANFIYDNYENKWSYWGSRTTDGCQPAFSLMAARNPAFGTAAYLNTELLQKCTVDGLLAGACTTILTRSSPVSIILLPTQNHWPFY